MRARRGQFRAARELLDQLRVPWVSVPGNHDLPLDRVLTRMLRPLAGYRRWIDPEAEPLRVQDGVLVLGISSSRRYLWKGGRIDRRQVDRITSAGRDFPGVRTKVLVLHHPVVTSGARPDEKPVRGARRAVQAAAAAGFHLILCGHDHVAATEFAAPGLLAVIAGTATSWRVRAGQPQSYNLITLADPIKVEVRSWNGSRFAVQ